MGRRAPSVELLPWQRAILERLGRCRTVERRPAERVHIVLGCADGETNVALAAKLDVDVQRVSRWRRRFAEAHVDLFGDEERSGSPGTFTAEQLTQLIQLACTEPKELGLPVTHWTPHELALCAQQRGIVESISRRHVARFFGAG
jgi:putative transposase